MTQLVIAALLAAVLATSTSAENKLEDWQVRALEKVKEYNRVRDARWQGGGMLYVFASDANIAWDTIADQVTCNHLRAVGMPENRNIMVVFYEYYTMLRLGSAICN